MKKFMFVFVALLFSATIANAQIGLGVKAGMNFNTMSDIKPESSKLSIDGIMNVKARTGFHVGVMYKYDLPIEGFAIQPELLYINKSSKIESSIMGHTLSDDIKLHYLQLPIGLQYGIDLVMFRPFVQVVPYIGYAIAKGGLYEKAEWKDINRFEYGIGLGAGVEIWKIQLSGRYCWDLGKVSDFEWQETLKNFDIKSKKNRGFELSIGFIF